MGLVQQAREHLRRSELLAISEKINELESELALLRIRKRLLEQGDA